MKQTKVLFIAIAMMAGSAMAGEFKTHQVYMPKELHKIHVKMLDGRDPVEIEDISRVADWRMMAETLLFQVAPVRGGCNCRIEYIGYEVEDTPHARSIEQVRRGVEISHGVAGFEGDSRFSDDIALSRSILKGEDFYVGFYTHEDRKDILALTRDEDIKKLRFGVGNHWEVDKQVLANNNFQAVRADTWNSLVNIIALGRADVVLQPFTASDDLSFIDPVTKLRFLPIPGVKMQFGKGRHYFVSKRHPDGLEFLDTLNRGLEQLESDGTLYEMMVFAGVINPSTADFRTFDAH